MSEPPIHAGCVAIGGRGVLIVGPSGSGKSDLAMRLIDRGAELVSDDYSLLRAEAGRLVAAPPPTLAGRIELRGVGILERPFRPEAFISLLVDLELAPVRLPELGRRRLLNIPLPVLGLVALEPSAPLKVEAALALYGLPSTCPL